MYELELPATIHIHLVQPVSLFEPVLEDRVVRQCVEPHPHVEVNGEIEYQVSSVDDSQIYRNQLLCRIRLTIYHCFPW